jgi:flagellar motility protein MotE (MotC chaperone)
MPLTKNDIKIIKDIVAEQSKKYDRKFDTITKKITEIEKNAADFRTYVREEYEHVHSRFDKVDSRFDKTDRTIDKLSADFIEITGGILANHEVRLQRLEDKKTS